MRKHHPRIVHQKVILSKIKNLDFFLIQAYFDLGGSISMGETSPMQIQNDFSSVRHGNELSPSQSRIENESEFDIPSIAIPKNINRTLFICYLSDSNTMDSSAASQIAGSSNIVQTPTKGDIQGKGMYMKWIVI